MHWYRSHIRKAGGLKHDATCFCMKYMHGIYVVNRPDLLKLAVQGIRYLWARAGETRGYFRLSAQ